MPTFGSLFAGIGGIDLGLERAGWECRFQVEWDPYCQHVLAHHWPDVPRYGDITAVDWSGIERVDLLAGGFPCQPFSNAGKRKGVNDDRWLWPEFARAIRELRPPYVLVENVPGLLAGHGGMGQVLGDLAELGYDAEWDSIPAAAVGAPHLRYRVWIVAYAAGYRLGTEGRAGRDAGDVGFGSEPTTVADTDEPRLEGRPVQPERPGQRLARSGRLADPDDFGWDGGTGFLGTRGWGQLADGCRWLPEPDVGRVAHGVSARVDRLRALGNAVVPQVVEVIGRRLLEAVA